MYTNKLIVTDLLSFLYLLLSISLLRCLVDLDDDEEDELK
jgi:hypothetical protein